MPACASWLMAAWSLLRRGASASRALALSLPVTHSSTNLPPAAGRPAGLCTCTVRWCRWAGQVAGVGRAQLEAAGEGARAEATAQVSAGLAVE